MNRERFMRAALLAATLFVSAAGLSLAWAAPPAGITVSAEAVAEPLVTTWDRPQPLDPTCPAGGRVAGYIDVNDAPEGDLPRDVVFTPDGQEVLVVHRDTDNLTCFDADTRQVTHTVAVGDFPVDVAVSPDGQYAVVPNLLSHSVALIDLATHTVAATVPVTGTQPYRVAVTADSLYAVVGLINDGISSAFSVIDLTTQTELRTFPSAPQGTIGFFSSPEIGVAGNIFTQFALSSDGRTIVYPDRGGDRVLLYDLTSGGELASLPTADLPTAVDVSADGTTAVVSHEGSAKTITEIDVAGQAVTGTFSTAENLTAQVIRITPDKSHALAAISNNLIFVNLTSGATTATLYTGSVGDIEFSYDGQYAFVSNFNARVIDVDAQALVKTMAFAACVDSAASPTGMRAVALNNRFREDIHFYNIDGAAGFFEGFSSSGAPPEGDATTAVDITVDGTVAVACNVVSRNVAVIDVPNRAVRSYVEVGDRPKDVRITPDGHYAVVCAMDANAVVIVDLTSDTVVAELPIYNRPGRVRISPDGQHAYVLNVAGTDRISFIKLAGAASTIEKQLPAGQTGVANGYSYTETSGIELSADGTTLAVCDSFNDLVRLFDTASQTQVAAVPVGDFPIRAAFAPDGEAVYVTNAFGDSLSIVEYVGGTWTAVATVPNIDFPLTVDVDPAGEFVYVGNAGSPAGVRVVNAETHSVAKFLYFADGYPRDTFLMPGESVLYAAATNGELVRIKAASAAFGIIDKTPLAAGPADLAFCPLTRTVITGQPVPDGVDAVAFTPGDEDGDGDIDLDDFAGWADCRTGPGGGPYDLGCEVHDFEPDGDVDLADFSAFQAAFTG